MWSGGDGIDGMGCENKVLYKQFSCIFRIVEAIKVVGSAQTST